MKTKCPAVILIMLFSAACRTIDTYTTPKVQLAAEECRKISEADIRKAYQSAPRLKAPVRVALYSSGNRNKNFIRRLKASPWVQGVYEIPPLLAGGKITEECKNFRMPGKVSEGFVKLDNLRYLAATARADVLVVYDEDIRLDDSPNILAVTMPAVVTAFFVPMCDTEIELTARVHLFDVKTPFSYGSCILENEKQENWVIPARLDKARESVLDEIRKDAGEAARETCDVIRYFSQKGAAGTTAPDHAVVQGRCYRTD